MTSTLRHLAAPFADYFVDAAGIVYTMKSAVTREQYEEILHLAAAGERQRVIAQRFGISQGLVSLYVLGRMKYPPGLPRSLKASPTGAGYLGVTLCATAAGIDKVTRHVHELVAEAFHGPCPEGQEVRHLNGNRFDNAARNLGYGTALQNAADREAHGRTARGDRNGNCTRARAARRAA
jgi:hypothetical protein